MIPKELLHEHPRNSNKQNRHTFKELRESIRENGFDETLLTVPRETDDGYWIISGNHRFRAGVAEGLEEFPCIVRDDWDEIQEQVELIRRNYVRGNLDKDAFTVAVNVIAEEHAIPLDEIREAMGFPDAEVFLEYYKQEDEINKKVERQRSENAPKVKMVDDLGLVLSGIFEEYGDTVDQSFIIFPAGGRKHMYIAATPALKRVLESIAEKCIAEHLDINLVLGGLLVIGMENSQFKGPDVNAERIVDAGTEDGDASFD
jgi:hypothetical protein